MNEQSQFPKISLIAAVAENGVIGRGGRLPWHVPSDLRLFRTLTLGKPMIMGRRTFEAIGRPLDGRDTIILSRSIGVAPAGTHVCQTPAEAVATARALARARGCDEIMVIGGAEVFRTMLPIADRLYITSIHATPDGDVHMPSLDTDRWTEVRRTPVEADAADEHAATLIAFDRKYQSGRAPSAP